MRDPLIYPARSTNLLRAVYEYLGISRALRYMSLNIFPILQDRYRI